ncbi:MAG TPA: hypothetical protein VF621_04350 [Pyrinomonadaceae bacterium]|jgi:hypothetical protein
MASAGGLKTIILIKAFTYLNALSARYSLVGDTPFLEAGKFR